MTYVFTYNSYNTKKVTSSPKFQFVFYFFRQFYCPFSFSLQEKEGEKKKIGQKVTLFESSLQSINIVLTNFKQFDIRKAFVIYFIILNFKVRGSTLRNIHLFKAQDVYITVSV